MLAIIGKDCENMYCFDWIDFVGCAQQYKADFSNEVDLFAEKYLCYIDAI